MFLEINGDDVAYTLDPSSGAKEIKIKKYFVGEMIEALDHAMCDEVEEWMVRRLSTILPRVAIEMIQADKGFKIYCGRGGDFHITDLATAFENAVEKSCDRISIDAIEMAMSEESHDYLEIPVTWQDTCICCVE